jgi:Flp pilus assembly protein TadD
MEDPMGRLHRIMVAPKVKRLIEKGSQSYNAGDIEEALSRFTEAVELDDEHEEAHYYLALALQEMKRPDEAETHYRRSIALKGNEAKTHADLAELLHHQGRREEAESEYRTALELEPSNAIAIMNLGTLLRDTGRFSEATELYTRARDLPDLDEETRGRLDEMLV